MPVAVFLIVAFTKLAINVSAQDVPPKSGSTELSLSDAVYADLALRGYLDNVSVFYADGKAVNDIKLNEGRHWIPASTVKTFAAMYAYKMIADKKLKLADTQTIDAKNEVSTELVTDELPALILGDNVTVERLIRQMITQSDNTAFNQLLDVLGRDNINNYIQSLGLIHSRVGSKLNLDDSQTQYEYDVPGYGINTTTAEDYAKAFLLIKNNKIAGSKDLFEILKQQKINNMIPLYLPKNVVCAHKTGDLVPLFHDGGICQDEDRSYTLAVFTNAGDPSLVAHLSEIIYTKNYDLIGQTINKTIVGEENHPLDPLVMNPPKNSVLGVSVGADFPTPEITAADLGVKASDLSLAIGDKELPKVIIPADSPFHPLLDTWQLTKKVFVLTPRARLDVDLETARMRLAEAKDLIKRGKTQEAQAVLSSVRKGLNTVVKNSAVKSDAAAQSAIQAVSETRFTILSTQLQQTKGSTRLAVIKDIANQAKETIKNVQPNIPEATNATNPTQKPLIGTITNSTPTEITVKTAGGQQITIPTQNNSVVIKEKQLAVSSSPASSISPSVAPTALDAQKSLAIGTSVALIGSTVSNHFSPSLVLTNVPKELAAPQPVTVVKVDTKNNTMVVSENGVNTQVNINKETSIRGADTNIPLKSVQAGDIVVVHGQPLTPVKPVTPLPTQQINKLTPSQPTTPTVKASDNSGIKTTGPSAPPVTSAQKSLNVLPTPKNSPTTGQNLSPTQTFQPKVIQGTTVQIIEKKNNIHTLPVRNAPSKSENKPQSSPRQNAPQNQPAVQSNPPSVKSDNKKK